MQKSGAINFHSEISSTFDEKYTKSPQFLERKQLWERFLGNYCRSTDRALDLGCGSGVFTILLSQLAADVVAVDGSKDMLVLCKSKIEKLGLSNVRLIETDIKDLFKHSFEKFDLVLCSSVLEYLDDIDGSIQLINDLLNPGGHFIFSIPNRTSFYRKLEPLVYRLSGRPRYFGYIKQLFSQTEIKEKLYKCGFEMLTHEYFGKTPILSDVFRPMGISQFSDNLLLVVSRSTTKSGTVLE